MVVSIVVGLCAVLGVEFIMYELIGLGTVGPLAYLLWSFLTGCIGVLSVWLVYWAIQFIIQGFHDDKA